MHFVPTHCGSCSRSFLVSADSTVDATGRCKTCGSRMPLIAGRSYEALEAQYFREIELAIARAKLEPTQALRLARALIGVGESRKDVQGALRELAKVVESVAVVRASHTTDEQFVTNIVEMTAVLLSATAAESK